MNDPSAPLIAPDVAADLAAVALAWKLGPVSRVTRLLGQNNETFLLEIDGDGFVARRSRDGKSPDDLRFELALMAHARAHGVPTAEVLPTARGEPWAVIGGRLWILTRFIRSQPSRRTEDEHRQVGEAMGRLHTAMADFQPPAPPPRPWHPKDSGRHLAAIEDAVLDAGQAALRGTVATLAQEVAQRRRAHVAIIHGGCRLSSVLFRDGRLAALLDFDSAREDDPAVDVAIMLWSFAKSTSGRLALDPARLAPLAQGFGSRCRTDEAFAQALPVRLAELTLFQGALALQEATRGGDRAAASWQRAVTRVDCARRCLQHAAELAGLWRSAAHAPPTA